MPKVYIVQNPMSWNRETNEYVPRFDFSPAEEYGELQFLLSPSASPFSWEEIVPELHDQLQHITPDDYVLVIGNYLLVSMVSAITANYTGGKLNILFWSNKNRRYTSVRIEGLKNLDT